MRVKKESRSSAVVLRVVTSFDTFRVGEEYSTEMDATVQGWINAGWMVVVDGGTDPAGPGEPEPDVPFGVEG